MIRLLIVDDHTVVRKGLLALLSPEQYGIDVLGEAKDGEQAVQMAFELQPDVILMDLQMPCMSGLQAIQKIKQRQPESRILVLSSYSDGDQVMAAVKAGALGYLLKESSPDELVHAIHSVALGHVCLPQELSASILGNLGVSPAPSSRDAEELTPRELDVLRCLASGVSNKEIAIQLDISLTTARTHVSSILRKLNLENRTQAALYARQHGLID
jgi:NarL family two-component system response regulator LiaR